MQRIYRKLLLYFIMICFFITNNSLAQNIKEIQIIGNERIPDETILMFSNVSVNDNFTTEKLNFILKELYNSNYFNEVKVSIIDQNLIISVKENPIIENVNFIGIKSKSLRKSVLNKIKLKASGL